MSSQRKIDSARVNGAKSRGPRTPDGKRRSCKNAIKHGLTARTIVLSLEDRDEFETLRDAYLRELQPQNRLERDLVDQIISARWHTDRICTMETAELDLELARQEDHIQKTFDEIDHETRLAIAFKTLSDDSNCLALLSRYEARHRRNYERALRLLLELRGPGLRPAPPCPDPPPAPEPPAPEIDRMQNEPSPISEHLSVLSDPDGSLSGGRVARALVPAAPRLIGALAGAAMITACILMTALTAAPAVLAQRNPNDRIGVASVGIGTRGHQLLREAQAVPNAEIRVICDIYEGNLARAKEHTSNPEVRMIKKWEEAVEDNARSPWWTAPSRKRPRSSCRWKPIGESGG